MKNKQGNIVSKVAECNIKLIIPVTKYYSIQIPGHISNLHTDDGLDMQSGWFDCLYDEDIITEEEWDNIESIQISISWEEMANVLKQKHSGIFPKKHIFPDIDVD